MFGAMSLRARLMQRAWRYRLKVNRPEVLFLLRNLSRGQTAIDAGAHKGAFTYWMCRRVGRSGKVAAFEPLPELAGYLSDVQRRFPFPQLQVVQAALSRTHGEASLRVPMPGQYLGITSFHLPDAIEHYSVTVPTLPLDDYCREHRLHPDFIKCDVEGHELSLLQGAERVLREDRPCLVVESIDSNNARVPCETLFSFLRDAEYEGFFFPKGEMRPISEFRVDEHQVKPWTDQWCADFAFVPQERVGSASQVRRAA